jgi:hypothetical protein
MCRLSNDDWVLSLEKDMKERLQHGLQFEFIFHEVMLPNSASDGLPAQSKGH